MKKATLLISSVILLSMMAGCGKTEDNTMKQTSSETSQITSTSSIKGEDVSLKDIISVDEAIDIYTKAYPDTDITDLTLELSFGKYFYHIDGIDDDSEYEVTINGETKELSDEKTEKLDRDEQNGTKRQEEKLDLEHIISIDKASEIAVKQAGFGEATEWSLDREF